MKTTLFLLFLPFATLAQKSAVKNARELLGAQDYEHAIPILKDATLHTETKKDPDTWYLLGLAYTQQALDTVHGKAAAVTDAHNALLKALSLGPEKDGDINDLLLTVASLYYNEGVSSFNTDPAKAYTKFLTAYGIANMSGGKRFAGNTDMVRLAGNSRVNAIYSSNAAYMYPEAQKLLIEMKKAGEALDTNLYKILAVTYQQQEDHRSLLALLEEAKTKFPGTASFFNMEINHYLTTGNHAMLLQRLEEAAKRDPGNAEIQFNLGNAYERLAFPMNQNGQAQDLPANFAELFSKAETAYKQAIAAKPATPDYLYNLGVIYYKAASDITRKMNLIKGMSEAEQKQYDALVLARDAQFRLAMPYFEEAESILLPHAAALGTEEKVTYRNALTGLREIYKRLKDTAKEEEVKRRLDALK